MLLRNMAGVLSLFYVILFSKCQQFVCGHEDIRWFWGISFSQSFQVTMKSERGREYTFRRLTVLVGFEFLLEEGNQHHKETTLLHLPKKKKRKNKKGRRQRIMELELSV